MHYRPLGKSGLTVSEIGFGAWGIGGRSAGETSYGDNDDVRARAALDRAFDTGITFYDTANVYGDGHSETLIGAAFAKKRDRVVIATKAGLTRFGDPPDFSARALRRSVDGSLQRLATDYIDLLQLHNPPSDLFVRSPESYTVLADLRREGKIRAFGVSVKAPGDTVEILQGHTVDAIQVNLNMLDVRAVDGGLLDLAQRRGVGVVARTPLNFGFLSGAVTAMTEFPPGDHRRAWPRAQLERWAAAAMTMHQAAAAPAAQTRSQVALRFCLSFGPVASVIPGILTPDEAVENGAASDLGPLPDESRDRVLAVNRRTSIFAAS